MASSTEGLHPEAEIAKKYGFWDGNDPDAPATREHAAIMAVRAYSKAVQDAEQKVARTGAERYLRDRARSSEYAARYDAVMETLNVDFDDLFPDWGGDDG